MKKLNKFFAVLVALAMMATLCVSMAFAADPEPVPVNETGHVYFTKTWATNAGITIPAQTFEFVIDQDTDAGVKNEVKLTADDIAFTAGQNTTKASNDLVLNKSWTKTVTENGETKTIVVPGKYVYTVTEKIEAPTGYTLADGTTNVFTKNETTDKATVTKKITFDKSSYTLEVYVDKDGKVVGVVVKKDGEKMPGTETTGTDNDFNFKNTYSETVVNNPTGSTPDKPGDKDGHSLAIQKQINASEGLVDPNQVFNFSTTVTFPEVDAADQYKAYVINADGTRADNVDIIFDADNLTRTYSLKDGQRLFFENIDYGATWTATETGTYDGYTMKTGTDQASAETVKSTGNFTKIENNYDKGQIPGSGIIISNLPYIALALVAIGGLVAYVVVRRRQSDEA